MSEEERRDPGSHIHRSEQGLINRGDSCVPMPRRRASKWTSRKALQGASQAIGRLPALSAKPGKQVSQT